MNWQDTNSQMIEALHKSEKEGGSAQAIKDEQGKVIAICGVCKPDEHPAMGLFKALVKEQEIKNNSTV